MSENIISNYLLLNIALLLTTIVKKILLFLVETHVIKCMHVYSCSIMIKKVKLLFFNYY